MNAKPMLISLISMVKVKMVVNPDTSQAIILDKQKIDQTNEGICWQSTN